MSLVASLTPALQAHISELHGNVYEEYCEECSTRYTRDMYTPDDVAGQYYDDMQEFKKSAVKLPKHAVRFTMN